MTSIVCIDDNPLVAEALARRLSLEPDFDWLGSLTESDDILGRLTELAPDLVLVDIDIPGLDAFALVEQISERLPNVRAVMFTGHARSDYLEQAFSRGAWGYISKSASAHTLIEALRRVVQGEVVLLEDEETGSAVDRKS